jgi:hypothetical protein
MKCILFNMHECNVVVRLGRLINFLLFMNRPDLMPSLLMAHKLIILNKILDFVSNNFLDFLVLLCK